VWAVGRTERLTSQEDHLSPCLHIKNPLPTGLGESDSGYDAADLCSFS
jgi:hypothetical protein